jgi:DNA polymerase-3 subunit delta
VEGFLQRLQGNTPPSVSFVFGEDDYVRSRVLSHLRDTLIPEEVRAFNLDQVDGENVDLEQTLTLCNEYPLMHSHRLMLFTNVDKLRASQQQQLLTYLENPSESTILVLFARKVDRRRNFFKTLIKKSLVLECSPPGPDEIPGWLQEYARNAGYGLTWEQASLIAGQHQPLTELLAREMDKLITLAGDGKEIHDEHIAQVIGVSREYSVFELSNAFFKGDFATVTRIYLHSRSRIHALQILAALANNLIRLWHLDRLQRARIPVARQAELLQVNPYALRYDREKLRGFRSKDLEHMLHYLLEADRLLKQSGGEESAVMLRFFFQVENLWKTREQPHG